MFSYLAFVEAALNSDVPLTSKLIVFLTWFVSKINVCAYFIFQNLSFYFSYLYLFLGFKLNITKIYFLILCELLE